MGFGYLSGKLPCIKCGRIALRGQRLAWSVQFGFVFSVCDMSTLVVASPEAVLVVRRLKD